MRIQALNLPILKKNTGIGSFAKSIKAIRTIELPYDTVSFSGRDKKLLSEEEGREAANKLRTSTSGYRAPYGEKFNDKLVYSLTHAVANQIQENDQAVTLVGGDTREATKKYAPEIAEILSQRGIYVVTPHLEGAKKGEISPVASPILALMTKQYEAPLSVLLTASHNPWQDGGYNFLTDEGAVADDTVVKPLADKLEKITRTGKTGKNKNDWNAGTFPIDPYKIYKTYIDKKQFVDFDKIKDAGIDIYYENFGGTGKYYFPQLMEDHGIKIAKSLSTKTDGPNPVEKNMQKLAHEVKKSDNPLRVGLANDGDSDRFGVLDENGNFVSTTDVLALCSYHLIKNKGMTSGTIIKNVATSNKLNALAEYFNNKGYDIDVEETPVGFKYLGGKMIDLENSDKPAILAGEESGGLTIRDHIPEKDGYVALMLLLDLIASEGKPLGEILNEMNKKIGKDFTSECVNMKFRTEQEKENAVKSFEKYFNGEETELAGFDIDYDKTQSSDAHIKEYKPSGDGLKLYLKDGSNVLIRKSGTEPVLRLYIDAVSHETKEHLKDFLLKEVKGMGGEVKS